MVFLQEKRVPPLPTIPDVSITRFMFDESFGRASYATSLDPYVCAISRRSATAIEQKENVELLAKGLLHDLGWSINGVSEMDKVVAIFALNTIDVPTVNWAIHRLGGVCSPINASYTSPEVATLLEKSSARAIFTVSSLLLVARAAASTVGIDPRNIYVLPMPNEEPQSTGHTTLADLFEQGRQLPNLEPISWNEGDSKRKVAFLSHSSGTSGPPKMAAVSHHNIIANVLQLTAFDLEGRGGPKSRQIVLGILPSSHVYGIVVISALSTYRGDSVIVLPKFDLQQMLAVTEEFKINVLNIVPPIIVALGKDHGLLEKYDLSSVTSVQSGGSPLDEASVSRLHDIYPYWIFRNAYGLTEIGACATITSHREPWAGSSGMIIPGVRLKLISPDGKEITECDIAGEIFAQSPGVILGYWKEPIATAETFVQHQGERWLRTGDVGLFRKAPSGEAHLFIVDRVKELIKVKGLQVSPAELESCLLEHPAVHDCAVTSVPDERSGERPKAYIQRSPTNGLDLSEVDLEVELMGLVKRTKSRHKWLMGGIAFIPVIPRSPSGKILRRLLKEQGRTSKL